jgi:hypothetical protein
MSPRRWLVLDLVTVTLLALIARIAAAALVDYAPYTDPAYYTLVAERLATGLGFTVPVIWSFLEVGGRLPNPAVLPLPSNGHWMPLTSIVAAGFMDVFGVSWRAGQIPMVVLSAALVPFTYLVAWDLWSSRWIAVLSAVLAIFSGPLLVYYPTIDNFAVFGVAGAGSIYASIRAVRSARFGPWLVLAGALAGLATLARVDGLLLAVAPAAAWVVRLRARDEGRLAAGAAVAWGVASAAAFGVVLAPWLIRDIELYGSPFPSAGGHTLWITSYNEQFTIGQPVDLAHYLAWGPGNIIGSKLQSWFDLLGRTAVLLGGIFFFTFIPGLWIHRRRPELVPFIAYWLVMFLVMGAVFTFHAPRGAFYHSAPAWLLFAIPMALASIAPVAGAFGRAWPFLKRPQTHRFLGVVGTLGAVALSLIGSSVIYGQWDRSHRLDTQAAAWFVANGHTADVVMYGDPATLALLSGNPGVAPSFDPYPVLKQVIEAYHVQWVVVQLEPGARTDALNLWQGSAGADSEGNHATWLAAQPAFEIPDGLRIYAVTK